MDKFEAMVKPGGTLIYDPNGITHHPTRKDISIYRIEASKEAANLGLRKIFNMIVLGGYLKVKPVVEYNNVIRGIKKSLPERYHHLVPDNEKAISRGLEIVETVHTV
jgi:2-oxoglutarate ferredoxin oxidoreductase subunit gamma